MPVFAVRRKTAFAVLSAKLSDGVFKLQKLFVRGPLAGTSRKLLDLVLYLRVELGVGVPFLGGGRSKTKV